MLLLKRDESKQSPPLLLSSTQPALGTNMILLLLLFSSLTSAVQNSAFFNSSSLITIPNAVWDLNTKKMVTFRTCSDSGNLISMNGSLTSSSSSSTPYSNSQELAVLLHNSSVAFVWSINGHNGTVSVGSNINNNTWYTVTLNNLLNSLQMSVVQSSSLSLGSVVVANMTYNKFLLDIRLTGTLKIGEGFFGCLHEGLGVNFDDHGFSAQNIIWDNCPFEKVYGCTNLGQDTDNCIAFPCQHGATCVDGVNNYTCVCPSNFNGTNCENDLAALYGCQIQPCMNKGNCTDLQGINPRRFTCTCPEGFTGAICENLIDLCRTHPCVQGACITLVNSYTCNCTGSGYTGVNCTNDIDECLNTSSCGAYNCSNYPGGFACDCPKGYDGTPCTELNECSSAPCQNGGSCTDLTNAFSCSCVPGYTGQMCENDIDECENNPCAGNQNMKCHNLGNSYTCACLEGFSGNPCIDINECSMNVCRNNASCTNTLGSYNCSCLLGFTGKNCSMTINACEPNPCLNNATCSGKVNNYTCSCLPGFTGGNCGNNINECLINPCQNNGTCLDQVNSYKCSCLPGWTGEHCQNDIDECQPNPCLFGAQCQNNLNSYNCTCSKGYEGLNCGIIINDCNTTRPCMHDGECFYSLNDYSCNCTSDWMGKNCSEIYDACFSEPCLNGANCTTTSPQHNYSCACPSGFTGVNCETNIDDCVNNTCLWYQKCYDEINNHSCGCPIGYTGARCETEVNECEANPCQNNATCANGHGNYTCTCLNRYINLTSLLGPKALFLTGYNGTNCENDINECDYNDPPICQAQGKCENIPPGSFTCYCKSATGEFHTGTLCEQLRSYCNIRLPEQACRNGGTCVDVALDFKCNCAPGFTGRFCEVNINECASSPCKYNGTCEDQINGYVCKCIEGLTGHNCEIDINDCEPNPCLHGGACQDHINSFSCDCSGTGFNGTTCENNMDDCVGNQCQNGGTCVDGIKEYSCQCLSGYTYSRCEKDIPECSPNPCAYNSKCLEYSNTSLYDKGDPQFVNFTYEKAAGYLCVCVPGLKGKNCSEDIDECLSFPCQHNSTCINIFKENFICSCTRGYEGPTCEREINECNMYMPCKNGGTCLDKLADYDCDCPTAVTARKNYAGKNCTTYLYGCDGNSNKCRNGNCIPTLIGNVHSFVCVCYPGYTGAICSESNDMSFRGNQDNYIKSQMNMSEFNLSLRFQTTVSKAVLLVWRLSSNAYVSIELTNGRVNMTHKTNNNRHSCVLTTLSTVNNSEYHQLNLTVGHITTLALPLDRCLDSPCHTQSCQASFTLTGNQLPLVSQVYIGSGKVLDLQNETFPGSYIGCMEDVVINDDLYYPGKPIGQYFGVSPGCSRVMQCGKDSCSGHGFCEDLWDTYKCQCYRPFYGPACQNEYQSATFGINQGSVATYRNIPGVIDDWVLSFFIITKQEEGFIIYFGSSEFEVVRELAYVGVYIKDGRIMGDFYKCEYTKHFDTSPRQISDGQRYFISLDIKATTFKVMLNSELVFQDNNVPASDGLCNNGYGFMVYLINVGHGRVTTISRAKRDADWFNGNVKVIEISNMNHQRWKRQANSSLLNSYQQMPGFQGVIQDLQVNNKISLNFNDTNPKNPVISNITFGAHSTKNVCNDSQCENGGNCSNIFYNDFLCSCPPGFTGKNCSKLDHCFFGTCPSGSTCQNLQEGFECISTASFNTDSSIITYVISGETPDPILTFDFRTRGLFGLIFLLCKGDYYFKLRVANGRLEMNWKLTSDFSVTMVTKQNKRVNDGVWYQAKFEIINGTNLKLQLLQDGKIIDDTGIVGLIVTNFSVVDMLRNGEIVLGSTNRKKFSVQWEAGFSGCLRDVRLGGQLMPFFRDELFRNNTAKNKFLAQRVENIGNNCNARNSCVGHSCLNKGVCVDLWNDYKCECPYGLEGTLCEDNPDNCASRPCLNGGVCVDGLGTFTCTCPKGFSGNLCQKNIDLCNPNNTALCANNSTCANLGYDFKCNCTDPDYTGWYCNVSTHQNCSADSFLCQNNAACQNTWITTAADTNVSSFNCTCKPGYEGPLCEKVIDYCSIHGVMCANNGQCINLPDNESYSCNCTETLDYTGFNCSVKIDNCSTNPCINGSCIDGFRSFICWNNSGYTSSNITENCQITSPCQHGECAGDFCNCTGSAWTGAGCSVDINECNSTIPACLHDGNCTNYEGYFSCNCSLGYQGLQCQTPNCSSICLHNSCQTNATDWWCSCPEYVEGDFCETAGPCYDKPCNLTNTKDACNQSIVFNNYTCSCKEGWKGVNCTDDINECANETDNKCVNGTCANTDGNYTCTCDPGYNGTYCDTEKLECDSKPCQNGGICSNLFNNYTCDCTNTNYTGQNCSKDINECELLNFTICGLGKCINWHGGYECNCTDKFLGDHCEFNNPCYNNTVCLNGAVCHHIINQAGIYEAQCICAVDYEGVNCEKKQTQTGSNGPDLGVIIGPIVGGVVLIILIIVIIAFVMTARSKRATRGAYSPSQQETSGSRVEMGNVLKKPPEERLI